MNESRDPAPWKAVASHPLVEPRVYMGVSFDLGDVITHPDVTPFWFGDGGLLFHRTEPGVYGLHAMFYPGLWGRRAITTAFKQAIAEMFRRDATQITVSEVEGFFGSKPPLSFGFTEAGEAEPVDGLPPIRLWVLTSEAFDRSPARRRAVCLQS